MSTAMKVGLGIGALVIILGTFFIGLNNKHVDTSKEPITIGIATILTGDFAALGQNIVKAANLTIEEVNKNGGINGRLVRLSVEDSGLDSKSGISAIQKLVNVDGIKYIVGGMSSNGTIAAAPIANELQAIVMTPVTGGKNVDEAGEYIFRTANSDVIAGRDFANAMIDMGYKNVGVVAEVTEYTTDIKNTFESTIKEKGGTVVVSEEFQPNTKDYRTLVSKVESKKPQALLVLSQVGTNAALFIKQSREQGFTPPLFTDFTLATNVNAKNILGNFDGIYFADPAYDENSSESKAFFAKYEEVYKIPSLIPFHAAATRDAIMMIVKGIKAEGDNSKLVKDWLLKNVKNYKGLMGTYSLDANGNSDLGFTMKVYKDEKLEAIK